MRPDYLTKLWCFGAEEVCFSVQYFIHSCKFSNSRPGLYLPKNIPLLSPLLPFAVLVCSYCRLLLMKNQTCSVCLILKALQSFQGHHPSSTVNHHLQVLDFILRAASRE